MERLVPYFLEERVSWLFWEVGMNRTLSGFIFAAVMIVVIVCVDLLFFRHRFKERLMVNIGIVLLFAAFYLSFLR